MASYLPCITSLSGQFHYWNTARVCICFPNETNSVLNKLGKEYKPRVTLRDIASMRECSPGKKEESYKYYKGIMELIKEFIDNGQKYDGFKKYISEETRSI